MRFVGPVRELAESEARRLVAKHAGEIFKRRTEALERLLILRLSGARVRLVEDRMDPLRTIWTFEVTDE